MASTGAPERDDPYRLLFDRLSAGAARIRLFDTRLDILDENAAFAAVRHLELEPLVRRALRSGSATEALCHGTARYSATAHRLGIDEVMVVVDDTTAQATLEQRFEQAFHGNAAAMVIARRDTLEILDVNPRWLEMLGETRANVIGKTPMELGQLSAAEVAKRVTEHRDHRSGYESELTLRARNGELRTVLASAKPIEIAEGPCTLTTLLDITARKQAEEAFELAFSASPAGMILVHGTTGVVASVNRRMLELTRSVREDLVGRDSGDLRLVLQPPRFELLRVIERTGKLDAVEVEIGVKGGAGLWTLLSTEQITLNNTIYRLSVFTDISARKRVERRLLAQHAIGAHLAESSALDVTLPNVIEQLCRAENWDCGAVWLPNSEGALRCLATWPPYEEVEELRAFTAAATIDANTGLLGRVLGTGKPEKIALVTPKGPHGAVAIAAGMRRAVAVPILRGAEVLGVLALAARDPNPEPLDPGELGLFDSVGRLLGLFVERTRAENSLRDLNVELEQRVQSRTFALEVMNRDLAAFTSSVSHDLRAPLRTMNGFSQILLEDYSAELPAEAKRLLTSIAGGATRLRDMIDHLLEFSRLGRNSIQRSEIELDPLVRAVVDELTAGKALDDRLELDLQPLGSANADPSLLRAVWQNLIDNALKYSRTRDRMKITIGCEHRDSELFYFVRDNGVGFDSRDAHRLFGVFQRLHSAQEFEGTGIGLANVRRIVEWHHGKIAATSELGRGSSFEFTLGKDVG